LGRAVGDPALLTDRARRERAEFATRFQQTCGPVMAKGVEDTAAYRWVRLVSLNEVGGDPARIGLSPEELHAFAADQLTSCPTGMTTLSTHDTKRSEDVRARLAIVSELGSDWTDLVRALHAAGSGYRAPEVDGRVELLIWQTLVGAFPIAADRLQPYVQKAIREAKLHTSWTTPDAAYEQAVHEFVERALGDEVVLDLVREWGAATADAVRATTLGQKLLQLVLPGVPDIYQGCESLSLTLVDPDNRRPVDHPALAARLAVLDQHPRPALRDLDLAHAKLLVTAQTLRLRREQPGWFAGPDATYAPVATTSGSALALSRGDTSGPGALAVMTRLAVSLDRFGGWGEHTITLPDSPGGWLDTFTDRAFTGGPLRLADLLADLPVALLRRA
jgi:(1->4)-alpha-D-glucan 1-alpha-D-glucosylmutase